MTHLSSTGAFRSDRDGISERCAPQGGYPVRHEQARQAGRGGAQRPAAAAGRARGVHHPGLRRPPVSAIAKRAGLGMGSLYRRYRTKEELLQRLCLIAMERVVEAASAGLAEDDPWEGFAGYVRACVGFGSGALAPVAGTIEVTGEMSRTARQATELARPARRAGPRGRGAAG
ncbi:TetR/AcrR family transcriptional regulator [Nonomuraea ferruginea]